jgi:PAS domain S-box-containing protein/putative nucleotidyltransferase with HDIG domain
LSRLLNAMAEGAYGIDNDGICTFVNQSFLRILGYQNDNEVLGKHIHELIHHTYPDGSPYPESECRAYCAYRSNLPLTASDEVFWRKDGVAVPVEYWSHNILKNGVSIGAIVTFIDITERLADESRINRLTRLYAALSQCNEAIVRCTSEEELFPEICRDAVKFGGMSMAWIGMVDEASKLVRPVASYGGGTEYLDGIQISTDDNEAIGRGPIGTAIRETRPYWSQDSMQDPNYAPWQERGSQFGVKSLASLPLLRNNTPVGAITFYSDTVNAFDEEACHLLTEMATDISFALDNFARESQRKRMTEEVKLKNIILQTQQETSLDALLIVDSDQQIISYNQNFIEMWQLPPQFLHANMHEQIIQSIAAQAKNTQEHLANVRHLFENHELKSRVEIELKDGRIIDRYSAPIIGENGKYYGRVSYFRDISARKHAEQELLDSEQRFRGLVEQSLAGIYIIQDGKLVYANPRAAEILGYSSADELIGHDPLQFTAEADRAKVAENMRQLFEKEHPSVSMEFEVLRKDGVTVSVGANASLATYHARPAILGLIQDISEKKRAEEQILGYVSRLNAAFLGTVRMVTSLGEMRDPYTAGHERRVAEIATAIAAVLGMDQERVEGIRVAGYLHDIGKISIPAEILVKPGRLSATEYTLVQGHAQASYDVLQHVEFPWPVATVALQHHERMDGSGYPNGLKGDEMLLESRIMAVADVVEAMASHRPYRAGLGIDKALAEIERGSGTSYDPVVVDACLRLFREQGFVLPPY